MDTLIYPKEKTYFAISLFFSVLIYAALIVSLIGILYIALFALIALLAQGLFVGMLRGNSIRVGPAQFPEVDRIAKELAAQMGIAPCPPVYVVQAGGMLNAFATRFLGRNFVAIYSDVLELAYAQGEAEVRFVVAHEMGHIKRKHLFWRPLLLPSLIVPFLAPAYYRACEYTCDRIGAHYSPTGAVSGLLVLGAGKHLYRKVNADVVALQPQEETGFWVWYAEKLEMHPYLPKRVRHTQQFLASRGSQLAPAALAVTATQ
jgi:Zn-dependent protease with chaperone function